MQLEKFSFGLGDRFGRQGKPLLNAIISARSMGIDIVPVWNKSYREHSIIGSSPPDCKAAVQKAVTSGNFTGSYYIDADHIDMSNVDIFIDSSNFFTLDIAGNITQQASQEQIEDFAARHRDLSKINRIAGIEKPLQLDESFIKTTAGRILPAIKMAGRLYRYIEAGKGVDNFITEISMDETDTPQSPAEMLIILAAISDEQIPIQTIAPKFSGRFNKGIDYVGHIGKFEKEFNEDLAIINYAVKNFGLADNLKLSIHSGSDKFSIYGPINKAIRKFDCGIHIKTAGTTWLEEIIGLALAGGDGLNIAKEIYQRAYNQRLALCEPYLTVIDINTANLPLPEDVNEWTGREFAAALKHDQNSSRYNSDFRQLLHVSYKVAAQMGQRYLGALELHEDIVSEHVSENILHNHIMKIFT